MTEKLGFVDVGSRGGLPERYAPYAGSLIQVLCEPEPEEYARLVRENRGAYRVVDAALAHIDGTLELNETINPNCSSILPVNYDFINRYRISTHFQFKRALAVKCARYDTLFRSRDLPPPHVVKIDVQGFESRVLQGFGALLHDCLAIELETHFYPLYKGQKLMHEIVDYLADYDMVLRRIANPRSADLNGDKHFEFDLVEVDAIFTKSKAWANARSAEDRSRLNLACAIMGVAANR